MILLQQCSYVDFRKNLLLLNYLGGEEISGEELFVHVIFLKNNHSENL